MPNKEIIGLKIKHGTLIGSEQQDAIHSQSKDSPSTEGSKHWYCIVTRYPKEESKNLRENVAMISISRNHINDDSIRFSSFDHITEATTKWKMVTEECKSKMGRSAVFLDSHKLVKMKEAGNSEGVKLCLENAKERGFYAEKKDEEVSFTDTIVTLYTLLNTKQDFYMMILVMILLGASTYLDLESQLLTGQVMGMVTTAHNDTQAQENWYAQKSCQHFIHCDKGSNIDYFTGLILGFVILKVTERFLYVLNVWFHHNACEQKNITMRMKAFEHVLSLDQAYFDTHSKSAIRGSMNVRSINNLITWNIPYLVTLTMQLFMTGIYMLRVDYRLGSFAIAGYFLIKFGLLKPCERIEHQVHKIEHKNNMMNDQIINETFDLIMSIKLFSKEQHHIEDFKMASHRILKNLQSIVFLRCFREFVNGVLQFLIFSGVLYYGLVILNDKSTNLSDLPAFLILIRSFRELFGRIKWHLEVLVKEFADIERFISLMNAKPIVVSGTQKLTKVEGDIEFKNVWFEYPARPGEEVLRGLNLKINRNKITAIVGDSGAGKSTIAKLLMRLYDPQKGSVTIDGKDLKDFDIDNLHTHVGIVNQNPELFNSPLVDNIGYGFTSNDYDQCRIEKASEVANCGFISKFRGKYDTFAGSRGENLSGGQKQRLAIARAAIRDPNILILDEATSSLDAENEALVQTALENVMKNRTTLIIAHRLSTIKNADHIICMKDGQVVEEGTHSSLMSMKGIYFKLVNTQIVEDIKTINHNVDDIKSCKG